LCPKWTLKRRKSMSSHAESISACCTVFDWPSIVAAFSVWRQGPASRSAARRNTAARSVYGRSRHAGAARNALDCALWDLEAKKSAIPAWKLAELQRPQSVVTAFTISLGEPEKMEADARAAAHLPLLKLKLAGEGDEARVAAVRRGAPGARLIVDANEAWTGRDIAAEAAILAAYGVELIEQPVKAGQDALLDGVISPIPFAADESCQDRVDLTRCVGRYQAINIKLDKAGGLTEALALAAEAKVMGLEVMVGCMLATSLGIAPAFLVAQQARWIDLDGALLLAEDRPSAMQAKDGLLEPPGPELWG